jgi:Xaa-Pro dipeptidase
MQTDASQPDYRERQVRMQAVMRKLEYQAVVLEPGPAMLYLTDVRWGKSERLFAAVLFAETGPAWVLPGFEEMRARELIRPGDEIRIWQEDESPYERVVAAFRDRGVTTGKIGMDDWARFFVFDGIRKLAPTFTYASAGPVLLAAGVK